MDIQFTRGRLGAVVNVLDSLHKEIKGEELRIRVTYRDEYPNSPEWREMTRLMEIAIERIRLLRDDLSRVSAALYEQLDAGR